MKYLSLLPLAALTTAFVVPNEQVFAQLDVKDNSQARLLNKASYTKDAIVDGFKNHFEEVTDSVKHTAGQVSHKAKNALDDALSFASDAGSSMTETAFDAQSWAQTNLEHAYDNIEAYEDSSKDDPHHGPPHHGPPHHHDGDHEHKPHHPPHHGKPNLTVYELISKSKYTTKLAKLIDDFPDLVEALNGTKANYTVFAPTDKAFEKIPEHAPKPTKEQLKTLLTYHVSPEFFPAGRVLITHTIPTLLKGEHLSDEPEPQRLSVNIGLRGLTLNFYSRVIAIDIVSISAPSSTIYTDKHSSEPTV